MPVYLGEYDPEPETEGELRILLRREAISTFFFGLFKEDGEECINHDKPSKREQLEGTRQDSDRREADRKRGGRRVKLVSRVSEVSTELRSRSYLTRLERLIAGTIFVPKKNVAILFAMKDSGPVGCADPPSRLNPVSSRNKRTKTKAEP